MTSAVSASEAREIAALQGSVSVTIEAPFVKKWGEDCQPEKGAFRCYELFFPLDGSGPHYAHAINWSHVKFGTRPDPLLFFLFLFIMIAEDTSYGSVTPVPEKEVQPHLYQTLVLACARKLRFRETKEDKKIYSENISHSRYVDHGFAQDVAQAIRDLDAQV